MPLEQNSHSRPAGGKTKSEAFQQGNAERHSLVDVNTDLFLAILQNPAILFFVFAFRALLYFWAKPRTARTVGPTARKTLADDETGSLRTR
jgi:hypothetical protein